MIRKVTAQELAEVLREMAVYVEWSDNEEDYKNYYEEIYGTGLFRDAIGKIIEEGNEEVTITTEY